MIDSPRHIAAQRATPPRRIPSVRSRTLIAAAGVVAVAIALFIALRGKDEPPATSAAAGGAGRTANAAIVSRPAQRSGLRATLTHVVSELARRRGADDPQYFAGGVWRSGNDDCWPCNVGPGQAAAVLASTGEPSATTRRMRALAIATFDGLIAHHGRADGSFGPASAGQGSRGIVTLTSALQLATAYLTLQPTLDPRTAARWRERLAAATRYVAKTIPPTYYVNGNINLGAAALFALTAKVTRDAEFQRLYQDQWRFTLAPPQNDRWRGFGLVMVQRPKRADGADGRAYLAESGGSKPGLDIDYVQLQTSYATQLFVLTRDAQARRLLNLLTNQLMTRVSRTTWNLDTSGGTRHPQRNREIPFFTPALATVAFAGRSSLLRDSAGQLRALKATLRSALRYSYGPIYRAVGDASLVLLA